jgi:hypothetical protein
MPVSSHKRPDPLTVLKPVFDERSDGELGLRVAVIDAVASELTDPLVELGVTMLVVVFEVPLEPTPLPTTLVPLAPNKLNSATVAPSWSPVAWQPLISSVTYCPDQMGDENLKYDMLPEYSWTTSLVAALYGIEMAMLEKTADRISVRLPFDPLVEL